MTNINKIVNLESYKKDKAKDDKTGEVVRFAVMPYAKDEKTVFVYGKRRRSYGYRYPVDFFLKNYTIIEVDENKQWHKRINRAIKALEESGLWPELLEYFNYLSQLTWEERKEIIKLDSSRPRYPKYEKGKDGKYHPVKTPEIIEQEREHNERIKPFVDKFPFMFYEEDGVIKAEYEYLGERSLCKLKSMYLPSFL